MPTLNIKNLGNSQLVGWTDVAIARVSAGLIEVNNGTAGSVASLKLKQLVVVTGTITASTPALDLTQTWNNAAVVFTGIKFDATNTNSAAGSKLLDLCVGGSTRISATKEGYMSLSDGSSALTIDPRNGQVTFGQTFSIVMQTQNALILRHGNSDGLFIRPYSGTGSTRLYWADQGNIVLSSLIAPSAGGKLQQRNGTTSQCFEIFNSYTDDANFERAFLRWSANIFYFGTEAGGTGTSRDLLIQTGGTTRLTISGTSNMVTLPASATLNLGTGSILRTRYINDPGNTLTFFDFSNPAVGIACFGLDSTSPRMQFAGTTNLFPAIKRSGAELHARLADDSGFAVMKGKLATDTSYSAGAPSPTGFLTLYDAAGTAYKVPAVAA